MAPQSRLRDKDLLAPERTLEFIEVGALLPREVKLARDGVRVRIQRPCCEISGKYLASAVPGSAGTSPGESSRC